MAVSSPFCSHEGTGNALSFVAAAYPSGSVPQGPGKSMTIDPHVYINAGGGGPLGAVGALVHFLLL